jgi:hypothetical protein
MRRQKYKNIQRSYLQNDNVTKRWHLGLLAIVISWRLSIVSTKECVLLG